MKAPRRPKAGRDDEACDDERVRYDDEVGWVRIDGLIDDRRAAELAARCRAVAETLDDPGAGDKPHGATRRLSRLEERVPDTLEVVAALEPMVGQILGPARFLTEVAFRSPSPGHGGQRLHADDTPRLGLDDPYRVATAIVALCPFTPESGATIVVDGSHHRPDLQGQSGQLASHPEAHPLTGPPGTGFVFNGHLLHAGGHNRSTGDRPALQISWRAGTTPPPPWDETAPAP